MGPRTHEGWNPLDRKIARRREAFSPPPCMKKRPVPIYAGLTVRSPGAVTEALSTTQVQRSLPLAPPAPVGGLLRVYNNRLLSASAAGPAAYRHPALAATSVAC